MKIEQYTYWSMTINNPDDNDWVLVRNPNEKYIRSLVWTREVGEGGTEHIQAWVRLQRNNSMTFMKKLYPRGHFRYIDRDEYNENTQQYAQKEDNTTAGLHHISLHDPLPANDTLLYRVLEKAVDNLILSSSEWSNIYGASREDMVFHEKFSLSKLKTRDIERSMVMERSGLEKIFCSPAYEKMKQTFYPEIIYRILKSQQDADESTTETTQTIEIATCEEGQSEDHEDSASETSSGYDESSDDETSS